MQKRNTSKTSCMLMPNGFYISSVIFGCCIMFIQAVLLTLTVRNAQFGFMFPLSLSFITSFPCATALFIFSQLCGGFMNISYICVSFQFFFFMRLHIRIACIYKFRPYFYFTKFCSKFSSRFIRSESKIAFKVLVRINKLLERWIFTEYYSEMFCSVMLLFSFFLLLLLLLPEFWSIRSRF